MLQSKQKALNQITLEFLRFIPQHDNQIELYSDNGDVYTLSNNKSYIYFNGIKVGHIFDITQVIAEEMYNSCKNCFEDIEPYQYFENIERQTLNEWSISILDIMKNTSK